MQLTPFCGSNSFKNFYERNLNPASLSLAPTVQTLPTAMTSLPNVPSSAAVANLAPGEDEQFLLHAFRSFAAAADSLERSYGTLRSEVVRLHGELAQTNAGLERSLEENREMRQHLDRILDGLPCGVLVARANGAISRVNPEAQRLIQESLQRTGDSAAGATGMSVRGFESLRVVPRELRELLERARSESGEQEHFFHDECGAERWLAVRHAAVEGAASGESRTINDCESIFILRDVSDAKRLVQEREKSRREQALAEMSAILAHEIRNPLGSLELFAGLLAEAGLSAECRGWVEHVQAGLRTLAATVNNVLHFHSLPVPERVPTDLGRLLDWAGGFLVPMARQARVELCLRNRLQGVYFPADRHRLEQVLLNLVLNALRAMPGGGWVEISGYKSHPGDTAAAISVSDTGPGLRFDQAAKIFEPGFSTRPGSPGLGLAVCRKIVEQHGGSLAVENRPGMGARFIMTFPLQESCT
jgi:two-component system sensor histidine kinase FlrB